MRRLLSMIMLALAAGTVGPAAVAVAAIHRPTGPAPQGFGVRLVDVPGSAANNPRALRYIIDYLPTGAVIHRRILVINQEARTAHFTVYADAARISNGSFTGDSGATPSELTGWISAQYQTLTLRPQASAMDMITIKVPPGATRGEHYGVIWVQQAAHVWASTGLASTRWPGSASASNWPSARGAPRRPASPSPPSPRAGQPAAGPPWPSTWITPAGGPSTSAAPRS